MSEEPEKKIVVQLQISCSNLKDTDIFSKTDGYVTVWAVEPSTKMRLYNLGRTEVLENALSPEFQVRVPVFENHVHDLLEFQVKDSDMNSDDIIGACYMTLQEIKATAKEGLEKALEKVDDEGAPDGAPEKSLGTIKVKSINALADKLKLKLRGHNIKSMDFFSKSDPYIVILQNGIIIRQTEVIDNTKTPDWQMMDILLEKLNLEQEVLFSCYDQTC